MPPVIMWIVGAISAAVVAKWLIKEVRRVNAELDAVRARSVAEPARDHPTLKRDPETGVYRPK
jgi:hypothetical protein